MPPLTREQFISYLRTAPDIRREFIEQNGLDPQSEDGEELWQTLLREGVLHSEKLPDNRSLVGARVSRSRRPKSRGRRSVLDR